MADDEDNDLIADLEMSIYERDVAEVPGSVINPRSLKTSTYIAKLGLGVTFEKKAVFANPASGYIVAYKTITDASPAYLAPVLRCSTFFIRYGFQASRVHPITASVHSTGTTRKSLIIF